ncbi:MAG: DUF4013 domain-containing protein [Anaerolineae bacterium]|nr:DUF4013 domain-containing protein [Anaerolineae bacterium]
MDFTKAITYPFDDQDWVQKLGIAAGIFLGGILLSFLLGIPAILAGLILGGWQFEILKRVKRNDSLPLPAFDDFGGLLSKGFTLALGMIVYQIPTILFACAMSLFFLLPAMSGGDSDAAAALTGVAGIAVACCSCLIILYAIAASIVYAGGLIRFADREELGTFFQIGENFALVRNNIGDFGMAVLYLIGAGLVAGVAGSIVPLIGTIAAQVFIYYFSGHILGQLAAKISGSSVPAV